MGIGAHVYKAPPCEDGMPLEVSKPYCSERRINPPGRLYSRQSLHHGYLAFFKHECLVETRGSCVHCVTVCSSSWSPGKVLGTRRGQSRGGLGIGSSDRLQMCPPMHMRTLWTRCHIILGLLLERERCPFQIKCIASYVRLRIWLCAPPEYCCQALLLTDGAYGASLPPQWCRARRMLPAKHILRRAVKRNLRSSYGLRAFVAMTLLP